MNFISVLLLTVAATVDSFIIGLGFGVKHVRIDNASNIFISILCLIGTFLAMGAGRLLGVVIPEGLADSLGGLVLIAFGIYMLHGALAARKEGVHKFTEDPTVADKDNSKTIELRESFLVGVMLSINNIGLGIGAGMAGMSILLTPLVCGLASFCFVKAGSSIGNAIQGERLGKAMELLASVLVLLLGVSSLSLF